ncbi:MAG: GNAT family N-acetyltransferase [Rhodospirillaceae bacterium]
MSVLEIRSATADDAAAIASVVRESWLDANKNIIPADSRRALTNSRNLAAFVAGEWSGIHVALVDGEIVGTAGVNPAGVIWMLYVLPAYQGCGVGSALYDAAIGTLKSTGQRKALLEVLAANENAVAFYRARGWVPEGRRTEHIPGFRFTALRMGLALA